MPPLPSRMTKNREQPTRYRPGKAEGDPQLDSEDEDSDEDEQDEEQAAAPKQAQPKASSFPSQKKLGVDLSGVGRQVSTAAARAKKAEGEDDGFVTASESESEADVKTTRKAGENASDDSDDDSNSDDEESDSSSSSASSAPARPLIRPTFLTKAQRAKLPLATPAFDDPEELERLRKAKADELLQAQLERAAADKLAGRRAWDDDADLAPEDIVDDTDDLNAEAEHAAWKLRELKRVRRDRLAIEEKEREREEVDRRRNMSAEDRAKEDEAFIAAQTAERQDRGAMGFMQKYHHKGAFKFAEGEMDEEVQAVLNRDLAGARFEDDVGDKSVLPEYMRIRDMTKLGKKGGTKYKDLRAEDTGRWGEVARKGGREGEGLDERFRPDEWGTGERTGANETAVGERKRRDEGVDGGGGKRTRVE